MQKACQYRLSPASDAAVADLVRDRMSCDKALNSHEFSYKRSKTSGDAASSQDFEGVRVGGTGVLASDQRERQLPFPSGSSNRVEGPALTSPDKQKTLGIDECPQQVFVAFFGGWVFRQQLFRSRDFRR